MGARIEIDGIGLTEPQERTVSDLVSLLLGAGHDEATAKKLAGTGFRRMHHMEDGRWRATAMIRLSGGHGVAVRSKFRRREDAMPRSKDMDEVRRARDGLVMRAVGEAGARNNKADKDVISNLVRLSLNLLNATDREEILSGLAGESK